MSERRKHLLNKAWFEATKADWLFTAPNPRVGALALAGGHIIGYGHHAVYGGPHAEEAALRDAGAWDAEANRAIPGIVDEIVVTLEPCSASGKKRPPCTQALLDAGVKTVLCGATDPDPRHQGAGLRVLEDAGIRVERLDEAEAAERFAAQNAAFLRGLEHPDRPWVLLKWAASLDGKLAADDGTSQWITGPEARAEVHGLRACSDGVAAGAGTVLADDPSLDARPDQGPPGLRAPAAKRQPTRVLFGGGDRVLPDARLFGNESPRIWLMPEDRSVSEAVRDAGDAVVRLRAQGQGLDLEQALEVLRRDHGIRRLLVEGGAQLHGSFLQAGLADAVVRYEAPLLLGGTRAACDAPSFASPQQASRLVHAEEARLGRDHRRAFQIVGAEALV